MSESDSPKPISVEKTPLPTSNDTSSSYSEVDTSSSSPDIPKIVIAQPSSTKPENDDSESSTISSDDEKKDDKIEIENKEESKEIIENSNFNGKLEEHHLKRYKPEGETLAKLFKDARGFDKKAYTRVEQKNKTKMWNTFIEEIENAACGLLAHEEVHGVVICMNNCSEAFSVGMGCILAGKYVTYAPTSLTKLRLEKIIELINAEVAFIDNSVLDYFRDIMKTKENLKVVVIGTDVGKEGKLLSYTPYISNKVDKSKLDESLNKLKPDTIAEVIAVPEGEGYKGVIWTHSNIMAAIKANDPGLNEQMTIMEILPNSSFGERLFSMYIAMSKQLHVFIADTNDLQFGGIKFAKLLKQFKPRFLLGVPRIYEKIALRAEEQIEKGKISNVTKNFAAKKGIDGGVKQGVGDHKPKGYGLARTLVYNKALKGLGLHKCYCACWGVISENSRKQLLGLGITVFEGLMLAETCGYCLTNKKDTYVPGCYGSRIEGINAEIKNNEIIISGPTVSPGYVNESKEHIYNYDNGYKTGLLASTSNYGKKRVEFFIPKGYKNPTIVTSTSEIIEPHFIEYNLSKIPTINKCILIGENEKFIVALFEANYDEIKKELKEKAPSKEQYKIDPYYGTFIRQKVEAFNQQLPRSHRVKKFVMVELKEISENKEDNPSMEDRNSVIQRYKSGIDKLYHPPKVVEQNDEKKRRKEEEKIQKQRRKEEKEREKRDKKEKKANK